MNSNDINRRCPYCPDVFPEKYVYETFEGIVSNHETLKDLVYDDTSTMFGILTEGFDPFKFPHNFVPSAF